MIDTLYLSLMSMRLLWFKTRFVFYRSWVVLFLSVSWLASSWCILTACVFVLASSSIPTRLCTEILALTQLCMIWLVMQLSFLWLISLFLPLDILLEYWIEHVSFGLLYVMLTFPTRIFYRGVPGFATDCPCGVWCRGLTTRPCMLVHFLEI